MNYKAFWTSRKVPSEGISPELEKYIKKHIKGAKTVLDFGVGTGRLLPLFKGKKVYGYDIVDRGVKGIEFIDKIDSIMVPFIDVVVVSKVFLHIPPEQLDNTMWALLMISDKIIVYDTHKKMTASHCFNHDFEKYGKMNDVQKIGDNLFFFYDFSEHCNLYWKG